MSKVFVLFDDTIGNIVIALQVGDLSIEQAGFDVWAVNDA